MRRAFKSKMVGFWVVLQFRLMLLRRDVSRVREASLLAMTLFEALCAALRAAQITVFHRHCEEGVRRVLAVNTRRSNLKPHCNINGFCSALNNPKTHLIALALLISFLCPSPFTLNPSFCPSSYATTVKSEWVIRDPRLRARVIQAMAEYAHYALGDSSGVRYLEQRQHSAEVVVEAIDVREENTRRLVLLAVDSLRISTPENIRAALGETLYDFVTARKNYEYAVNRTSLDERLCASLWWPEEKIRVALDRQFVLVAPQFAIVNEIGNANLSLPWWQYGMFRIGVAHPNFRFMFQGPFAPGLQRVAFLEPRHIDGAFGGAFQFRVENWSGELAFASMSKQSSLYNTFVRPPFLDYVSTIFHARYSITAPAGALGAFEISFGGGLHKVQHDSVGAAPQSLIYDASQPSPITVGPLFRVSFVSAHDDVELTGQYYHSSLFLSASVHLGGAIWVSGSALLIKTLRPAERFEPNSFVFVTPEIRL